jgi:hypothetical protein
MNARRVDLRDAQRGLPTAEHLPGAPIHLRLTHSHLLGLQAVTSGAQVSEPADQPFLGIISLVLLTICSNTFTSSPWCVSRYAHTRSLANSERT